MGWGESGYSKFCDQVALDKYRQAEGDEGDIKMRPPLGPTLGPTLAPQRHGCRVFAVIGLG